MKMVIILHKKAISPSLTIVLMLFFSIRHIGLHKSDVHFDYDPITATAIFDVQHLLI